MAQKIVQGNEVLASKIKFRRNELGLTIEEAALRAGVGTKTWSRYEEDRPISVQEYRTHEAWSCFLENGYGTGAAISFATGSDILLDQIGEDMAALACMPAGSYIGQLEVSWLRGILPDQFLMQYDYQFLYQMKCTLRKMRLCAKNGLAMTAHSVMEELLLYLCYEEASALVELSGGISGLEDEGYFEEWVFDLFDDMDIISFLYSDVYVDSDDPYHFSRWGDQQFYTD